MLSVEIRVNTALIGYMYIHNEKEYPKGTSKYLIEYYRPDQKLIRFYLNHKRSEGAEVLIQKAFNKIKEMK